VVLLLPLLLLLLPVFVSPAPAGVVGVGVQGRLLEYGCWLSQNLKQLEIGRGQAMLAGPSLRQVR